MIETIPRIGDEVYVHGYIDEIRKDIIIIRNEGGYFGTVFNEVIVDRKVSEIPTGSEKPNNCEMPCEECGHWEHGAGNHYYCALLEMGQECYFESKNESTLMFANEPKTEPLTCDGNCWMKKQNGEWLCEHCQRKPKTEPQTCANGCKWLNQDGECTEPSGVCHIEYRTEVDEAQTDCAWKGDNQ